MADQIAFTTKHTSPDLQDYLNDLKKNIFLNLNCHGVGKVVKVDVSQQTVDVQLFYKKALIKLGKNKEYKIESQDYPTLLDCPFVNLRGGQAGLTLPIAVGDECLIFFNDRSIDDWFTSGQILPLSSNRMHSISDAIALVGINSIQNLVEGYDATRAVLYNQDSLVAIGNKIEVKNGTESLGPLISELVQLLSTLTITIPSGPGAGTWPVTPSIAAQISAIKTRFESLLE